MKYTLIKLANIIIKQDQTDRMSLNIPVCMQTVTFSDKELYLFLTTNNRVVHIKHNANNWRKVDWCIHNKT